MEATVSFEFDTAEHLKVGDSELTEILREVYVDGGFTDSELAEEIFKANAVRDRGAIFCVRNRESSELAGIVILVAPSSKASRLAKDGEVEMQLLGVRPKFRGQGLGKLLVAQAIAKARADCCSKMVLWTQRSMVAAHHLYESNGFLQVGSFENNGREFLVYSINL
ncbi:hypothetical protein NBRC116585_15550 [Thalassolituus maritimus]|jgi:ribosomal protein S18 acetylase RimI-like enzyme|uniref:N-acetyltransferase domain-containing protein n=1 Tax=Thalassolituus maritimus TaxID=484498 RepID=A0ABP9ZZ57_9GAMM